MRKFFILFLLIAFAAIMINAGAPKDIRLTMSGSPATTQTISWSAEITDTANHILRYKKAGSQAWITAKAAASEDFKAPETAEMSAKLKSVTLTGLSAATTYEYQISGDNGATWTPKTPYKWTTANDKASKFKFIIVGDTSNEDLEFSGKPNRWAENITNAFKNPAAAGANFFMNAGDTVDQGQKYEHWSAWITAAQDVLATKNAMLTVSKDECNFGDDYAEKTGKAPTSAPVLFPKLFKYPQNGPANYKGIAYSFDYGNVHIASIPNQFEDYHVDDIAKQEKMFEEISAWLKADLAATKQQWKIVVMHLNMYTTMTDRSNIKYRPGFQKIFDEFKVDVVFDAHVHTIARTYPIRNNKYFSKPSEGTVYYTVGMGQSEPKDDVSKKIWHAFTFDGQKAANYFIVDVDSGKLKISCFLHDGTKVDEYLIDKVNPVNSTPSVRPYEYDNTHAVSFGQVVFAWDTRLGEWDVVSPSLGSKAKDGKMKALKSLDAFPFQDNINKPDKLIIPDFNGNGKSDWYIDIATFTIFMNGVWKADPVKNKYQIIYDDLELVLDVDEKEVLAVKFEDGSYGYYLSEIGLRNAKASDGYGGFVVEYDKDLNLIFIERYR